MASLSRDRQGQNKWRWSIQMSSQDRRTESLNLWLKCPSSQPDDHKAPPKQRDRPASYEYHSSVHLPSFKGVHSDWLVVVHSVPIALATAEREKRWEVPDEDRLWSLTGKISNPIFQGQTLTSVLGYNTVLFTCPG